jgi:hypothetical protein
VGVGRRSIAVVAMVCRVQDAVVVFRLMIRHGRAPKSSSRDADRSREIYTSRPRDS